MKKSEEITQIVNKIDYFCDMCSLEGKEKKLASPGSYGEYYSCYMCDKDICRDHLVHDTRDIGDYPTQYCTYCWKVGEKYRKKMEEIEEKCDEKLQEQKNLWEEEALKKNK